jgi:hypothetical protein
VRLLIRAYRRLWWALRRFYVRRARRERFRRLRQIERELAAYGDAGSIERRRAAHQDWQRWR